MNFASTGVPATTNLSQFPADMFHPTGVAPKVDTGVFSPYYVPGKGWVTQPVVTVTVTPPGSAVSTSPNAPSFSPVPMTDTYETNLRSRSRVSINWAQTPEMFTVTNGNFNFENYNFQIYGHYQYMGMTFLGTEYWKTYLTVMVRSTGEIFDNINYLPGYVTTIRTGQAYKNTQTSATLTDCIIFQYDYYGSWGSVITAYQLKANYTAGTNFPYYPVFTGNSFVCVGSKIFGDRINPQNPTQ